jgi:hypothetical protein
MISVYEKYMIICALALQIRKEDMSYDTVYKLFIKSMFYNLDILYKNMQPFLALWGNIREANSLSF